MNNRFPKSERLCGELRIKEVNSRGHRVTAWPLRAVVLPAQKTQVLVWAPKVLFKHAVDRNHLRRLMREAYRLEAKPQLESAGTHCLIAIYYFDKSVQSYQCIAKAMGKLVNKILADVR